MLTIRVEEEHIRLGRAGKSSSCPIALAMIAAGCTFPLIFAVPKLISWGLCNNRHVATAPESVLAFVRAFDHRTRRVAGLRGVEPFTFTLEGGL